jgi:hypothetical protein
VIGNDGPSKTMGMKPSVEILEKEAQRVPGPGAYSPSIDGTNKSPPKYGIGTSKRHDFTRRTRAGVEPGPGKYNPNDKFVKSNSSKWVFGSEIQRPHSRSSSPGPGEYNPKSEKKMKSSP